MNNFQYDFAVIGAGITGLALAHSLMNKHPGATIGIFEKELHTGQHGSGRNSGVLHSGIYYPENTLKAKFCANGSKQLAKFCEEHNLPICRMGKVIVPTRPEQDPQIDLLYSRGLKNGATVSIIDRQQLHEIEPEASSATDRALHSPNTAVVDSLQVLIKLNQLLKRKGATFHFGKGLERAKPEQNSFMTQTGDKVSYGILFNAAGQHADRIAHLFGTAKQYTLLPFKGMYFLLDPQSDIQLNGLVYPVPDLNVPFLGVHSVKKISGEIYFGPTAIPALGREHYAGLKGIEPIEAARICNYLAIQYWNNQQGFRNYAHEEAGRFIKSRFAAAAKVLIPRLQTHHLIPSSKVGIRAQLLNIESRQLEMDFLVHKHNNTLHVLNAVSPAFTSSFPFADHVVEMAEKEIS
jgi:(S)-2-hydroxyglutarate dehydrogenase